MKNIISIVLISTCSFTLNGMLSRIITIGTHYSLSLLLAQKNVPIKRYICTKYNFNTSIKTLRDNSEIVYTLLKEPKQVGASLIENLNKTKEIVAQVPVYDGHFFICREGDIIQEFVNNHSAIKKIEQLNNDIDCINNNKLEKPFSLAESYKNLTITIATFKWVNKLQALDIDLLSSTKETLTNVSWWQKMRPDICTKLDTTEQKLSTLLFQTNNLIALNNTLTLLNNPKIGGLMLLSPEQGKSVFRDFVEQISRQHGFNGVKIETKMQELQDILKKENSASAHFNFKEWVSSLEHTFKEICQYYKIR